MRLFSALDTPYAITEEIHAWWLEAGGQLNIGDWRDVPMKNWHLTLAFYGDVKGDEVDSLAEALAEYVRGTIKEPLKSGRIREGELPGINTPIGLKTTALGAFPRFSRPRVLWAGVDDLEGSGELKEMARCCRRAGRATVRKRSAKESPFRGHITLARANEFAAPITAGTVADMPPFPKLVWEAESLSLFQSTLYPDGAKYRRLEEFRFEGKRYVR
jgi:2'-5' RNA ligase